MIIRRLIVPLTMAVFAVQALAGQCPGRVSGAAAGSRRAGQRASPFPPVNGVHPPAIDRRSAARRVFPSSGAPPVARRVFAARPQQARPAQAAKIA